MADQNLSSALGPGPDCPSIEQLGHYADGVLPDAERRAQASHIEACANCQAELGLLQAFATTTVREDEAAVVGAGVEELRRREAEIFSPVPRDVASRRRWFSFASLRPALAVAALLLCVSGGYYLINMTAPRLPTDVGSGSEATRSLTISAREPIGDLTTAPARLQWQAVGGATRYHARLMEVDRHEIWSGDTTEAAIDLPAGVQAQVRPSKTLVWQVTAYGASNTPIAESEPQRFRLAQ